VSIEDTSPLQKCGFVVVSLIILEQLSIFIWKLGLEISQKIPVHSKPFQIISEIISGYDIDKLYADALQMCFGSMPY